MPLDKAGRFHGNIGRAMAADKNQMPAPKPKAPHPQLAAPSMGQPEPDGDESGAGEHLKAYHDAMGGGKAMLVHHDGIQATAHNIGEDGEISGPHDLQNLEELKQHMDQFFTEEEQESL
jgi:hypothetical protein